MDWLQVSSDFSQNSIWYLHNLLLFFGFLQNTDLSANSRDSLWYRTNVRYFITPPSPSLLVVVNVFVWVLQSTSRSLNLKPLKESATISFWICYWDSFHGNLLYPSNFKQFEKPMLSRVVPTLKIKKISSNDNGLQVISNSCRLNNYQNEK